jgi:nitroreductase
MEVYEAIRTRKSVRSYLDRPIEEEKLLRVLHAARSAPSARNGQEWRFVVVRDRAVRERIAVEAARQPFIGTSAALLICCAQSDARLMRCGQLAYPIDVAIAMDHLTLAATAEGLGTCWIGSFDETIVKDILGIPADVRVVEIMPLGYPSDASPAAKSRMALGEIVMFESWGGTRPA